MNNLFTYLASRRDGPLDHLVNADILAAWGITPCVTPRCLEASFQFTHDHDDLQWLSHGACIVGMSLCRQTSPIQQQRGYTHITRATTCVYMQIIPENISLSHGSLFQASEHFKMPYLRKARGANTVYNANPYQRIISQHVDIRQKIRAQHCFQNSLIS